MYKQKILNKFYEELFSTDFNDYETPTQNEKTDSICMNSDISFEEWLDNLIETFCDEYGYEASYVKKAIDAEPEFEEDMKAEFEYLKEEIAELDDDEEEDEEDL